MSYNLLFDETTQVFDLCDSLFFHLDLLQSIDIYSLLDICNHDFIHLYADHHMPINQSIKYDLTIIVKPPR